MHVATYFMLALWWLLPPPHFHHLRELPEIACSSGGANSLAQMEPQEEGGLWLAPRASLLAPDCWCREDCQVPCIQFPPTPLLYDDQGPHKQGTVPQTCSLGKGDRGGGGGEGVMEVAKQAMLRVCTLWKACWGPQPYRPGPVSPDLQALRQGRQLTMSLSGLGPAGSWTGEGHCIWF